VASGSAPAARRSPASARPPPRPLAFARPPLLFQAPLARGAGRTGRAARRRLAQRVGDLRGEAAQRQLAVARLPASVLGDGGDQGAAVREQRLALALVERA
jgi:hypothetical protein